MFCPVLRLWRHRAVGDAYEAAKQSFRKIIPVITSDQVSYETRTISEKLIETALYELEDDQLCALAASFKLLAIAMEDGDAVAICGRLTTEEDLCTGQNPQGPRKFLEFFGEIQGDVAQEVESVAKEGFEGALQGFFKGMGRCPSWSNAPVR